MSLIFQEYDGVHVGIGVRGRRWQVRQGVAGWRLEFRDPGEPEMTYAGMHGSLAAAMREARWQAGVRQPNPDSRHPLAEARDL